MLTTRDGLLVLNQFSSIVATPSMESLVLDTDYSIVTNTPISCTVVNSKELLLDEAMTVEKGEGVFLTIDGYNFKNIVDNIDSTKKKIILIKDILDKGNLLVESGTITVKYAWSKAIQLINVAEGNYLVKPINKKIVVRESYVQPFVAFEDLSAELVDAINLKESRMDSLNRVGLKQIYAALSGLDNYYDIIDEVDLERLLYLKIECMLSKDSEDLNGRTTISQECRNFQDEMMKYTPKEKFEENEDGSPSENITENLSIGEWSL